MSDQPKPNQPATPPPAPAAQPPKDTQQPADKPAAPPAVTTDVKPEAPAKPANVNAPKPPAVVPAISGSQPAAPAQPAAAAPAKDAQPPAAQPAVPPASADAKPAAPAQPPAAAPAAPVARDISEDPTLPGKPKPDADAKPAAAATVPLPTPSSMGTGRLPDKDDTIPPLGAASKVTQRFGEPPPAAQSAGIICPSCGHRNRPGTLICDNCGTNLVSGMKAAVGTRDLVSASEAPNAPVLNETQLKAIESAGGSTFTDDMVLRIEIEGGATPMLVYPKQEIILGRRDPNTGTLPDVDMTAYSGYRMGVSRTHASIRLQDKQLNLSDRGSSNGTFLNGTRLVAHRPYPLKDGDEIRLGQMVLKIFFQSSKNRS